MDIKTYLQRINYQGSLEPTPTTLHDIHLAHVQNVPFENIDIQLGIPLNLDTSVLFEKIVVLRRGGFCYELNKLFAWLLQELGFNVSFLAASEANNKDDTYGIETHLVLQVECPGSPLNAPTLWLADVGYGNSFAAPLQLDTPGTVQHDILGKYRVEHAENYYILWHYDHQGAWGKKYRISRQHREIADFVPMCNYHQTSSDSFFTRHQFCTMVTQEGRISLLDHNLIILEHGIRHKRRITYREFRTILRERFGIDLDWSTVLRIKVTLAFLVIKRLGRGLKNRLFNKM